MSPSHIFGGPYLNKGTTGCHWLVHTAPTSHADLCRALGTGYLNMCHLSPNAALMVVGMQARFHPADLLFSALPQQIYWPCRSMLPPPTGNLSQAEASAGRAEWVAPKARSVSDRSFLTAALSSDSRWEPGARS